MQMRFSKDWNIKYLFFFRSTLVLIFSIFFLSCGTGYKDLSTENGRKALMEQANNYLTGGQCTAAIEVLKPLYESQYVNTEVRLIYASAHACVAGFNFPSLITGLTSINGSDIWSPLIKTNYNSARSDNHLYYLKKAASILRETASTSGSFRASDRPSDVNLYMVFIQAEIISKTILLPDMGNADPTTGKQQATIIGKGDNEDKCYIVAAFATIADSLTQVSTGTAINSVSSSITNACGGACPTNKDPSVCTVVEQAQGDILLTAIDGQWQ